MPKRAAGTLGRARIAAMVAATMVAGIALAAEDCEQVLATAYGRALRGELNPALAGFFVNNAIALCPNNDAGPVSPQLCATLQRPVAIDNEPVSQPETDDASIGWEILQFFLSDENYSICRDIFESPELTRVLLRVPSLSTERLEHYKFQGISRRTYRSQSTGEADTISADWQDRTFSEGQLRLISLIDQVAGWNYCARVKFAPVVGSSMRGRVLGQYSDNQITIFYDACVSGSVYGVDLGPASATHRGFLIAAHELGHVVDKFARTSEPASWQEQEDAATLYGSYFAQCGTRLLKVYARDFAEIVRESEVATEDDIKFVRCAEREWFTAESFIDAVRKQIVDGKGRVPSAWAAQQYGIVYEDVR